MLDQAGVRNHKQATAEDALLHAEVATIAAFVERLGDDGRSIEDVSIEELRAEGLSNGAIELVINGTPAELRAVLGRYSAVIVKMHRGGGPGGSY